MGEVEENLKKLIAMKGVTAVLVMTSDGAVIRTTMEPGQAVHYAAMYAPLVQESRIAVTELGGNSLKTIRLRTTKHEVVIIPGKKAFYPKLQANPTVFFFTICLGAKYSFLLLQQPDASFDTT
ncbi:hypothetical protein RvY_09658 [Ramazzottius varieornatus]|uniref:Roadblock/LAMTOR2 domain-containing protein n=1 Tax=Ramazzottius varieornatus TaxID=947166 RepID=A0A1D1VA62_RAMVA|nr:hypothetical protein RvY_09658 [Ramazzottius varieornatus]